MRTGRGARDASLQDGPSAAEQEESGDVRSTLQDEHVQEDENHLRHQYHNGGHNSGIDEGDSFEDDENRVEDRIAAWGDEEGIDGVEQVRRGRLVVDLLRCASEPTGFDEGAFILEKLRQIPEAAPFAQILVSQISSIQAFKELTEVDLIRLGVDSRLARSMIAIAKQKWHRGESLDLSMEDITSLPPGPLHLFADVNLSTCILEELPDDLTVNGKLNLSFSSKLKVLPSNLHVEGDLLVERCIRLREIQENIFVGGSLVLKRCEALERLPIRMELLKDLVLASCRSLTTLPDDLHIHGHLNLKRCEKFKILPNRLQVDGRLTLRYSGVRALPEDITLNGDLDIADCDGFHLCEGFELGGSLLLDEWTFGDSFPRSLHIKGSLDLEIMSLANLPPVRVDGTLRIGSSLRTIESPLYVGKHLAMISCSAEIPQGTIVEGRVDFIRCHGRRELRGVHVGSALVLQSCSRIKLIDDIELDGTLRIEDCNSLKRIGSNVSVKGGVVIRNCHRLNTLPENWQIYSLDIVSASLTALPSGLQVKEFFRVSECPIDHLPDDLDVGGSVEILCDVVELPPSLSKVNGDLVIQSKNILELPSPLRVASSLRVSYCEKLRHLDGDLRVGFDVSANSCPALHTLLPDSFHALGSVSATSCFALTKIGQNVQIEGNLSLEDAVQLQELDNIYIGQSLFMSNCSQLQRVGDNVSTGLDMILRNCISLTRVPRKVKTAGVFSLNGCTSMETLDCELDIGWDIDLRGTSITQLPKKGHVRGDFFAEYLKIEELPAKLIVDGHIGLRGCTLLTRILMPWNTVYSIDLSSTKMIRLPDNLHIKGDLLLCKNDMETLPAGLRVEGQLNVSGCWRLRSLPDDLYVGASIFANNCTLLSTLPKVVRVQGDFGLANAVALTELPDELEVSGRLDCNGCSSLWSAGQELTVYGSCTFAMCVSLSALPEDMYVGGDLDCFGCASIESLPPELYIGGALVLAECIGISTLPSSLLNWGPMAGGGRHVIDVTGTSIFEEHLDELRAQASTSVNLVVTRPNASPERNFTNLLKAVEFWYAAAMGAGSSPEDQNQIQEDGLKLGDMVNEVVPKINLRDILLFLSKLTVAKEYKREDLRQSLAKRVVDVLHLLADEEDAREELLTRMGDSVDACGDKPIQALNQMAVIVRTVHARGRREALRELAVGIARLEVVQRHAQMKVDSFHRPVDEVVIFLRFEVALAPELDLPVPAVDQLFPNFVLVTDDELNAAKEEALQITGQGEAFEAWLSHWSEWQRQLRLEAAKELSFERLKRNSRRFSLSWMDLFGNRMDDPIRIGKNSTIWSMQDLLRHWVRTGMDLNNTPRTIEEIRHMSRCKSLPRKASQIPELLTVQELDAET